MTAAKSWCNSREYQEILGLRTANAISDLILVDSVDPDFTSANWAGQIRRTLTERLLDDPSLTRVPNGAIFCKRSQDRRKVNKSALIVSAWVVGMPCGNPS